MRILGLVLAGLLTATCTFNTPAPTRSESSSGKQASHKGSVEQLQFRVSPKRAACQGIVGGPHQCLVLNGQLFYDNIAGYTHQPGRGRFLSVERRQVCDPAVINDCPQDASIFRYRLLKVIE